MAPPQTLLTFIDRPSAWPTALRGDLLARYHRSIGRPIRHWIITRDAGLTAADCAQLGIRTAGVATFDDYADSAQVMADRLLMTGVAYDAGRRIYLPWVGDPSYAPPQNTRGRRSPNDIQLWGPHWTDGPVGPSATLVQIAATQDHASGCADWIFGYDTQAAMRLDAVARALRSGPATRALRPPLRAAGLHTAQPSAWTGPCARWAAMQCKTALSPAQSQYGTRQSSAARLARMPDDHPQDPGHLTMVKHAEAALERLDWRDANRLLLGLCKTVTRMQTGHVGTRFAPSRQMRTRIVALLDALGL